MANPTEKEKEIVIRKDLKDIPLLRRKEKRGNEISPTLAYTYGCCAEQAKRIAKSAGFSQRFTYYAIRRGVANTVNNCKCSCI